MKTHYSDEFENEVTLSEFWLWVITNAQGFVLNLSKEHWTSKKPLYEWLSWFLAWTEYEDYLEGKHADDSGSTPE